MPAELTREEIECIRLAARQEGYREGIEAAARWHEDQAGSLELDGGRWDGAHTSALLTAAADHRRHAAAIRAFAPPPAEPNAPVAEGE